MLARVEQGEGRDADPPALEDEPDHLVDGEVLRGRGEPLLEEGLDRVVRVPEHGGVVVVRADALQAVDQHLAERADVLVPGREDADLLRLRVDRGVVRRRPRRGVGRARAHRRQGVADRDGLPDHLPDPGGVEVDVGERREERVGEKAPRLVAPRPAGLPRREVAHRDPPAEVEQDVHQAAEFLVLAADAADGAPGAPRGLLALVTEHACVSPGMVLPRGFICIPNYK